MALGFKLISRSNNNNNNYAFKLVFRRFIDNRYIYKELIFKELDEKNQYKRL